jgi:CheY-like chemotaxis protein
MTTASARDAGDLKSREILVVEPEDGRRARLSRLIRRAGARVTTAADGLEALPLACLGVYEVVVIGTVIPDMAGAELARSIRSQSPWTQTVQLAEDGSEAGEGAEGGARGRRVREPPEEERILRVICAALSRIQTRTP